MCVCLAAAVAAASVRSTNRKIPFSTKRCTIDLYLIWFDLICSTFWRSGFSFQKKNSGTKWCLSCSQTNQHWYGKNLFNFPLSSIWFISHYIIGNTVDHVRNCENRKCLEHLLSYLGWDDNLIEVQIPQLLMSDSWNLKRKKIKRALQTSYVSLICCTYICSMVSRYPKYEIIHNQRCLVL